LKEGIIIQIQHNRAKFYSSVFIVPKPAKNGKKKWRMVIDMRWLNWEIQEIHFKMDGPEVVETTA
jgi:hypothetical protein